MHFNDSELLNEKYFFLNSRLCLNITTAALNRSFQFLLYSGDGLGQLLDAFPNAIACHSATPLQTDIFLLNLLQIQLFKHLFSTDGALFILLIGHD
jgi:hypothetical protein